MNTPVLVTFANQKGGVGKTTLCITFANFLYSKGVRVIVVDCDFQHSIVKCRKSDLQEYGEEMVPYDVIPAGNLTENQTAEMIEKLCNDPSIDVVLIDSAGTLNARGLVSLLINTNIIITPFHYDVVSSPSTLAFLIFVEKLKLRTKGMMNPKVFAIPNLSDARVGRLKEKKAWTLTREKLAKYSEVTEAIPSRAAMGRLSTIAALDRHLSIVSPVFDKIYQYIFSTPDPLKEIRLEGIQLTSKIDVKDRSARESQTISSSSQVPIENNPNDTNDPIHSI